MKENITGMMVYYYFVCKRKLWYFCHEITMETENACLYHYISGDRCDYVYPSCGLFKLCLCRGDYLRIFDFCQLADVFQIKKN